MSTAISTACITRATLRLPILLAVFSVILLGPARSPLQAAITVTDLGPDRSPRAISNTGYIAGSLKGMGGHTKWFLRSLEDDFIAGNTVLPGTSSSESAATGVNDTGQVAGVSWYWGSNGHYAFSSDTSGNLTDLGSFGDADTPPFHSFTQAFGINNAGNIVGLSTKKANNGSYSVSRAFRYSNGTMTDLGTLSDGNYSQALDINDYGEIVGNSQTKIGTAFLTRAFFYSDGTMIDLGTLLTGKESYATAINNSATGRKIAGYSDTTATGNQHAFLYDIGAGTMSDLGTLGGNRSFAYGINDYGQVVGSSITTEATSSAFLYDGGTMIDLNDLLPDDSPWRLTSAYGINNLGQIVGDGYIGNDPHGFLLTLGTTPGSGAVPEPTSLAVWSVACLMGIVGARSARRRRR